MNPNEEPLFSAPNVNTNFKATRLKSPSFSSAKRLCIECDTEKPYSHIKSAATLEFHAFCMFILLLHTSRTQKGQKLNPIYCFFGNVAQNCVFITLIKRARWFGLDPPVDQMLGKL